MSSPATYAVYIDTDLDGTFDNALDDVSSYVLEASWSIGFRSPYLWVAEATRLSLTLDNASGDFDVDRSGAAYEDSLSPNMLVKVVMTYDGTDQQMWVGRIVAVDPLPGPKLEQPFIRVVCLDLMYDLGRFSFAPELLTNVTTDVAIQSVFDEAIVAYPYEARFAALGFSYLGETTYLYDAEAFTSFETGVATIPFAGAVDDPGRETVVTALMYIRELMDNEAGGRFFWDGRTGAFTFHNRHHDLLTSDTLTDDYAIDVSAAAPKWGDDIVNDYTVRAMPKVAGTPNSILYDSDTTPFTIRQGQTRRIQARFRDPDNPDVRITASTVVTPILGTHVTSDDDSKVSMAYQKRSNMVIFDLSNVGVGDVEITDIVVRGTPLLSYNPLEVREVDAESMKLYNRRADTLATKMQVEEDVRLFAQQQLAMFSTPKMRVDNFEFWVEDANRATWAQNVTIGDIIQLDDTAAGHSGHLANYVVVGEEHELDGNGPFHRVRFTIRRQDKYVGTLLGVAGFAELGETTWLVF